MISAHIHDWPELGDVEYFSLEISSKGAGLRLYQTKMATTDKAMMKIE